MAEPTDLGRPVQPARPIGERGGPVGEAGRPASRPLDHTVAGHSHSPGDGPSGEPGGAPSRTIVITGARGGHGASTVAAVVALFAAEERPTSLVARDPASTAVLLGIPGAHGDGGLDVTSTLRLGADPEPADLVIVDAGLDAGLAADPDLPAGAERYVVVRGPCYLALHRLLLASGAKRPDGVIVVVEPGRSLRSRDVVDTLGVPLVAELACSPAVARTVDAGLLVSRARHLPDLRPLRPLALRPPRRPSRASTTRAHPTPPPSPPSPLHLTK